MRRGEGREREKANLARADASDDADEIAGMRVEVDVGERERRALVGKDDGGRGVERRKRYLSPMGSIEVALDGGEMLDERFCR